MSYTRRDMLTAGLALSAGSLLANTPLAASATSAAKETNADTAARKPVQPTWNSLRTVNSPPQWLRDGKFGIYTHWGVYSVPAYGSNGTWYAHNIYTNPDSDDAKHHLATYGP